MDKKRLKIALAILDAIKSRFPETQEFIDSTLKEECKKEKMTVDEVIFLLLNFQKEISLDKHFSFRFGTIVLIFYLQMWKGLADGKKTKRLSKEEIKKQLLDSMIIEEVAEICK